MEMTSNEDVQKSKSSSNEADHHHDYHEDMVPDVLNHGGAEPKYEIAEKEARGILEVIASTGKFWHEWDKLKAILSFQLKQVLSEYPETKMTSEQQNASLGETFTELAKRLEEALHSFDQGPPFTLQRLCEILLDARAIYPNLLKLALALEKNLLVTSMLTISTDPYPHSTIEPNEPDGASEELKQQSDSVENGIEHAVGDKDEVMVEVEEADINDNMTIDMEALEDIVVPGPSETSATPTNNC
ncbi:serine/threonine-protein phosphatase 4 regulatory subunit 2 [Morus notabilis]|nr:serine/threonine-protein phosphatase 4 regulatory subunit 2 [Morus notabilis]